MLRMEEFELEHASTYEEALALWGRSPEPMYIAGGTDMLPNLKHRLFHPKTLISLASIRGGVREEAGHLVIEASTRLDELAAHPLVRARLAPLATAAGSIAGPQIRTMGTIGGNVLLDTRCLYYNQTEFWRSALGYCLKADGTWCHVVAGPKTCVATQSSDTVPVLLTLDASLTLLGPAGRRVLKLRALYKFNGMDHLALQKGELLTEITVPVPGPGFRGSYDKLRTRDSIDFPQLGLAIAATFEGALLRTLDIVVGAVNPQPKGIRGLDAYAGRALDAAAIQEIADLVHKQTRPQGSVHGDTAWRRQMAAVYTRRALTKLAAG